MFAIAQEKFHVRKEGVGEGGVVGGSVGAGVSMTSERRILTEAVDAELSIMYSSRTRVEITTEAVPLRPADAIEGIIMIGSSETPGLSVFK